jgi:hypothetical protein
MTWPDWQSELSRIGGSVLPIASATEVRSEILKVTGRDAGVVAVARIHATARPVEIQIRKVLAGRYNQENFVAVAVLDAPAVRGTATVRAGSLHTFARFFRHAPWWQKVFYVCAAPLAVPFMLPGFLLFYTLATITKRASGISSYGSIATEAGFRRRYAIEARSRQEAEAAVPASLQRALVESDVAARLQLTPGRVVVERRLAQAELLEPFVREVVPRLASAAG